MLKLSSTIKIVHFSKKGGSLMKTHEQYDEDILKEINDNADLVTYVSQTMDLEKRGEDYFTHCPKHIDKTPSLSFTPSKNAYYCFSCGRSGKMIGYLMEFEGLDFEKAVKKAATIANVNMSNICRSETITFLKRFKNLTKAKKEKYIHKVLSDALYSKYDKDDIIEWRKEGISKETLDLFQVRIDNYKNRIVYPVYDLESHLINIKGRTRYKNWKDLKIPKYVNYYSVGVMDYFQGLNITLPYVKKQNEIIVFESIKSVMKAYDWGFKNCVSAEKHTLTEEQIDLLIQLKVNVVIAFDSDVDYHSKDVWKGIERLKLITNVYLVTDKSRLLGGIKAKNAPVDCGQDIWQQLYSQKKKVV